MTTHSSAIQREMRVRTSLQRAPSEVTLAESAARLSALEAEVWHEHGAIVLRETDAQVGDIVKIWGEKKFGKRQPRSTQGNRG